MPSPQQISFWERNFRKRIVNDTRSWIHTTKDMTETEDSIIVIVGGVCRKIYSSSNLNQSPSHPQSSPETVLLQFDFPTFLRERTRAAAHGGETIRTRAPTNAIALANFGTMLNLGVATGKKGILSQHRDPRKHTHVTSWHLVNIATTYLKDPAIATQQPVNAAVPVEGIAVVGKRGAVLLQALKALLVLAKGDAGTPARQATCEKVEKGEGEEEGNKVVSETANVGNSKCG